MNTKEIIAMTEAHYLPVFGRFPIAIDHGEGATLYDADGKAYIDFLAGIATNALGYHHPAIVKAVCEQTQKVMHTSNLFYTEIQAKAAQQLAEVTGMDRVFFANSGAEANEGIIKLARKYGSRKNPAKFRIITAKDSFHGRTMETLTATGQDHYHEGLTPLPEGFTYVPFGDLAAIEAVMDDDVCGVLIEPIQGEGGVHPLDKEYVQQVAEYAHAHDILIIVDEVQTGNGRTGYLYSYMGYGIQPDIVSTAKAIGGGLPLGATMFADSTQHTLTDHTHGSTFGGNPICTAGGISIIDRLDDALMEEVREKGKYIKEELEQCEHVDHVSGMGLMIGVTLKNKALMDVVEGCVDHGVLVLTANGLLRLLPPLNIPWDELKEAISIVKEVIDK